MSVESLKILLIITLILFVLNSIVSYNIGLRNGKLKGERQSEEDENANPPNHGT